MAKSLTQAYGSQATTPSPEYPGGTFLNKDGINPGTPLEHAWARNIDGYFQKLMADAGMGWLGSDDTALSSQYLQALQYQLNRNTKPPMWSMQDVCEGLFKSYTSISRPDVYPNFLDLTAVIPGVVIRDSCVGVSRTTQLPILYVLTDSDSILPIIGPFRYDNFPGVGSALDLEFSAGTMESVRSICCDGESLYVLWRTTSNTYWVTSFYTQSSSGYVPQWNYNLNMDYSTDEEYSKIIIASSLHLAVSSDNISGKCGVAIVPRAGTGSAAKGSGNGVSSPVSSSNGRIVSDGSHVYWLSRVINGTNHDVRLCSAKIVDPTVSDYTGGVIYSALSAFYNYLPKAICNFGGSYGTVVCAGPTGSFHLLVKSEDDIKYCITIDNHEWYSDVQDYNIVSGCDGYNLWLQLHQQSEVYDEARLAFAKIPLTQFMKSNTSTSQQDYTASMVLTNIPTGITTGEEPGRLLFDGMDMWFVSRSGFLCRITNPGMR
jgi:hypothetical protein